MTTVRTSTSVTMSRRMALVSMWAAASLSGRHTWPLHEVAAAVEEESGTWNWSGNAGHTGELPGPGLNLDGALREMWRLPAVDFGRFAGYLNGVVYTANANEMDEDARIAAWNLLDGRLLWTLHARDVATKPADTGDPVTFESSIAIDGDIILATLSNAYLLAVDAQTGDLRWEFDAASDYIGNVTVVDHVAYFATPDSICALHLGERPEVRWKAETDGHQWWWLGVDAGLVFIHGATGEFVGDQQTSMRALKVEDGAEYWRTTETELGDTTYVAGMTGSELLCMFGDMSAGIQQYLGLVDGTGSITWSNEFADGIRSWFLGDLVATVTSDETYTVRGIVAGSGDLHWEFTTDTSRWDNAQEPVFCAGLAYIAVDGADTDRKLVVVADPGNAKLVGTLNTKAVPFFVGDGVMLARDDDTDEVVAIGAGSAIVRVGSSATLTEDTTLRGAPGDSAVEREQLTEGTVVSVTGEGETVNDAVWLPVSVSESASSGWLRTDVLEGVDGSIQFSTVDISDFGQLTIY